MTKRLSIAGRVQGVGFRFFLQRTAQKHGLTGWVRNRRDGSVEAVVHGDDTAVAALIEWAQRGPRDAMVERLDVSDADGSYPTFEIRPTA